MPSKTNLDDILNFMSTAHASPGPIVRWEILKGLPGEGPVPKHFHLGHPTPWAEGFVVRFWNEDGSVWIANFQSGVTNYCDFFEFPDPRIGVIVSRGACYFLPFEDPQGVTNRSGEITSTLQTDKGNLILVSLTGEITVFDRFGVVLWHRNDFAADELILRSCVSGTIIADVQDWEGNWHTIRVSEKSGIDR
ncbi:MAG TPA: hypothetical protein VEU96_10100 [Bryobacteraceae bacterium]|nr:hypothetical protein [Bryobacteraceae bacterium]